MIHELDVKFGLGFVLEFGQAFRLRLIFKFKQSSPQNVGCIGSAYSLPLDLARQSVITHASASVITFAVLIGSHW